MPKYGGLKTGPLPLKTSDLDPLSLVTRVFRSHFLRDRFNILNRFSPFSVSEEADPIPTAFDESIAFTDLMDERAKQLLADNETIVVSWSGGVDSTGVVVALLRNLPREDYSRIKVIGTEQSINEGPNFYKTMLDLGINVNVTNELLDDLGEEDCDAVVSGWCADQLFGSDVHLRNLDLYNKPWIDALDWHVRNQFMSRLSNRSKSILFDVYMDYAKRLGVNVEQWCEFAWMFNFGVKYTFVKEHARLVLGGSPNQDKICPFFDTLDFQRYSVSRFPMLRGTNIYANQQDYKVPLKQYIYGFSGDKDYLEKKGKVNSWASQFGRYCYTNKTLPILIDEGLKLFTNAEIGEECDSCQSKMCAKVGEMFRKEGR